MDSLDIVELIETNPLTRLKGDYKSKLVNKIRDKFDTSTQKLFISTFYVYLNYDSRKDFIINLGDVWKWCGFSRIDPAKRLLTKFFVKGKDYLVFRQQGENPNGGRPKEDILLNVNTFKRFCLKARTTKADEIHDYFITLEEIIHELIEEESEEIVERLTIKDKDNENTLIENFRTKPVVYIGLVDNYVKSSKQLSHIRYLPNSFLSQCTQIFIFIYNKYCF